MRREPSDSFEQTRADINLTSVELLLTDSDVALTFLSIAETTDTAETATRNIQNARRAYDSIQSFRVRYVLTDLQTATLNSRLSRVKSRLEALGQVF